MKSAPSDACGSPSVVPQLAAHGGQRTAAQSEVTPPLRVSECPYVCSAPLHMEVLGSGAGVHDKWGLAAVRLLVLP